MDRYEEAPGRDDAEARALLATLTQLEREIVELRFTQRLDATDRIREALRRLAETGAPPLAILERAAAELGAASGLRRVLVGRHRHAAIEPAGVWSADGEPATNGASVAGPIEPGWAEADVAGRPRAIVVDPALRAAMPAAAAALGRAPFVLAAIVARGETVALVHARAGGEAPPGELERELVELFAAGLGPVLERAALEQALARHRGELAAAARFLARRLAGAAGAPTPPPGPPAPPPHAGGEAGLTGRELEVLALLAEGATNRAIGQRLAISEGTVKYHVKNILRKLHARSRADAVSRHLRAARPSGVGR